MKKMFILIVCALSLFSAGCTGAEKAKTTNQGVVPAFTSEQQDLLNKICDKSDDSQIFAQTTFTDYHCYNE